MNYVLFSFNKVMRHTGFCQLEVTYYEGHYEDEELTEETYIFHPGKNQGDIIQRFVRDTDLGTEVYNFNKDMTDDELVDYCKLQLLAKGTPITEQS